jgi:hypothetical protein
MAVHKSNDKTPVKPCDKTPVDKIDYTRIAIDATVIAGALIFLTISSIGIVIPSHVVTPKTQVGLLLKAFPTAVAFVIIVPFSIDALGSIFFPLGIGKFSPRLAIGIGFVVIPLIIGILSLLYLLASFGLIPNYTPQTNLTSNYTPLGIKVTIHFIISDLRRLQTA